MKNTKQVISLALMIGLCLQGSTLSAAKSLATINTVESKGKIVVKKEGRDKENIVKKKIKNEIKVIKEASIAELKDMAKLPKKQSDKKPKVEAKRKKVLGSKDNPILTKIVNKIEAKNNGVESKSLVKITAQGPMVRVLLKYMPERGTVISPSVKVDILDGDKVRKTISKNKSFKITEKRGNVYVDGKKIGKSVVIRPSDKDESSILTIDGNRYRGGLIVKEVSNNRMAVINNVSMEEYLCGVLPKEVPTSWPKSALEAQAVAARTYAYYALEHKSKALYDVETDTRSQVYQGVDAEVKSTNQAVIDTKGLVMKYAGKVIDAVFHADAGGYTEDAGKVWGKDTPYLRSVAEVVRSDDKDRTSYMWTVETTRENIESKLKAASKDVGRLKEIKLSSLTKRPMSVKDRGKSGRILQATIIGKKRKITLSGNDLKAILGLKSSCFDFYVKHQPPKDIDDTKKVKTYHNFGKGNEKVYIKGYGYGHGLGLSQWGAAYMAKKASPKEKEYFKKILKHYYQGVKIEKIY